MNKQKSHGGYVNKNVKSTVISALIGEAITVALLFLFALLIYKVDMPHALTDVLVIVSAVVGALFAGYINGKTIREKGIFYGGVAGIIIVATMLIVNLSLFDLAFTGLSIFKYVAILIASCFGGIIGVNRKVRH